jgi:hypothetical protein
MSGNLSPMLPSVFAHQGGWDEILFVVVPIAIFAGLLVVANRRATRIEEQRRDRGDGPSTPGKTDKPGRPGKPGSR